MGIYERKQENKNSTKKGTKKTRKQESRPRKRSRKQENRTRPLITFWVEFLFSYFLVYFDKFPPQKKIKTKYRKDGKTDNHKVAQRLTRRKPGKIQIDSQINLRQSD